MGRELVVIKNTDAITICLHFLKLNSCPIYYYGNIFIVSDTYKINKLKVIVGAFNLMVDS